MYSCPDYGDMFIAECGLGVLNGHFNSLGFASGRVINSIRNAMEQSAKNTRQNSMFDLQQEMRITYDLSADVPSTSTVQGWFWFFVKTLGSSFNDYPSYWARDGGKHLPCCFHWLLMTLQSGAPQANSLSIKIHRNGLCLELHKATNV